MNPLRKLLGRRVTRERERMAAEVSQALLDSERVKTESDKSLRRAYAALDAERLASYGRVRLPHRRGG